MSDQQQPQPIAQGGSAPNQFVNVLCLDGGGVRGLSSLLILRNLFQRLSNQHSPPKSILPCDIFDIICGTSTGGIIALMLGRLRMSVDDAIVAYLGFSKTVFEKGRATNLSKHDASTLEKWTKKIIAYEYFSRTVPEQKKAKNHPIYDASKLEEWIKNLVSQKTGDKRASLPDHPDHQGCRTFVVAVREAHADAPPKLFRTYAANGMPADKCEIWEAARATTAAFPFFKPASFGTPPITYVDGQFSGANNPSQLAIEEVESVFPSRKIGCLLSLGTGKPGDVVAIPQNERGIADACEKILKSCETVHDKTFQHFQNRALQKEYIRLSVDRGLGKIQLDEWERETELTGITDGYLAHREVEAKVTECIEILKETAEMNVESIT